MKLGGVILTILVLIALPVLGWYFFKYRPSHNSINETVGSNTLNIAPVTEWNSILIGKWEYSSVLKGPRDMRLIEGKITFDTDSTFRANLTMKFFEKSYDTVYRSEPYLICGGGKFGIWGVYPDEMELSLLDSTCDMLVTYDRYNSNKDYNPCSVNNDVRYGNYTTNYEEGKIRQFSNSLIQFQSHIYTSGGDFEIKLTRNK